MTWDKHTNRRVETLHPIIIQDVIDFINKVDSFLGIKLRVTSALRTFEEQDILYSKGRTTPGRKVTNAKGGQSYHNYGLAFDVVEIKGGKAIWNNPRWDDIGNISKDFGFEWGGNWEFTDKPHFQNSYGESIEELQELYKNKKGKYIEV